MLRTTFLAPAFSLLCLVSSQALVPATASASILSARTFNSSHVTPSARQVKMTLANSGSETLNVLVGDKPMTIEPGKAVDVSATAGTNITCVNETKNHKAGEVLLQISKELNGSTLRIG